jgi:hypothetical protein
MRNIRGFLLRMIAFLIAVGLAIIALYGQLADAFIANPALNGLILGVLLLGIAYIFGQVILLIGEEKWIDYFRSDRPGLSAQPLPKLLAPMAAMLGARQGARPGRLSLSAMALRSLLDGIMSRLEESRDLSRYLIGLLIFLGLLGTFWGLLQTISSVAGVIGGLSIGAGGDMSAVFAELKTGLKAPLSGMGTAFSSSLFGLAGSLVLGFLDLQAGQAQNRFYNELEEWLSGLTRISGGPSMGDGDQSVPAYVQALLEQTADSLESLQRTLERGEESRISSNSSVVLLAEHLGTLTDQMKTEQSLMMKLAENQLEIKPLLAKMASGSGLNQNSLLDDGSRSAIRSIDTQLARLIEELATGRAEMTGEIRSELRVLSRTLAAIAERAKQ